jgi:uncharacterized membrane protein
LRRLMQLESLQGHVPQYRYEGSTAAVACAEPDWSVHVSDQTLTYTLETGRAIRNHVVERASAAEAAAMRQAREVAREEERRRKAAEGQGG